MIRCVQKVPMLNCEDYVVVNGIFGVVKLMTHPFPNKRRLHCLKDLPSTNTNMTVGDRAPFLIQHLDKLVLRRPE